MPTSLDTLTIASLTGVVGDVQAVMVQAPALSDHLGRITARRPEIAADILAPGPARVFDDAVAHGLAGHEGPVTIRIELSLQDNLLILRVTNTMGPVQPHDHDGVGLRNVRERLAVQFGDKASLEAGPTEGGQWVATLRIPALLDGPGGTLPAASTPPLPPQS